MGTTCEIGNYNFLLCLGAGSRHYTADTPNPRWLLTLYRKFGSPHGSMKICSMSSKQPTVQAFWKYFPKYLECVWLIS